MQNLISPLIINLTGSSKSNPQCIFYILHRFSQLLQNECFIRTNSCLPACRPFMYKDMNTCMHFSISFTTSKRARPLSPCNSKHAEYVSPVQGPPALHWWRGPLGMPNANKLPAGQSRLESEQELNPGYSSNHLHPEPPTAPAHLIWSTLPYVETKPPTPEPESLLERGKTFLHQCSVIRFYCE